MPRPVKCRTVGCDPDYLSFKPAGVPASGLEEVEMTFDEYEALRLADVEGLYQEAAAGEMQVSRQTFGNILASARRKVALLIVEGRRLTITGGTIMMSEERKFKCAACGHAWSVAFGVARPVECPACKSEHIHRLTPGGGFGGGRGGGGRCRGLRTGLGRQERGMGQAAGQGRGAGRHEEQGRGKGRGCCGEEHGHGHQHGNGGGEGGAA